ncbi:MAG: bifunctional hydroxymethylpyrimidine kinase/phosphomethylpyrimidine kinase [Allosphingosinicella sp.]|uniref:bifunctional hydroxymethylpyrimidine kinase/phosphomethylpyrimidine kinase n=1 Tax=Allosphingosinicella sp. TaxID=2823234 RepID=UPI0039538806
MVPARILVIAGSDSGGGAGIQADIKTIAMLGGHPMTAITALTAQNTLGVSGVMPVPSDFVVAQIDAVMSDLGADAVKIGMIGSAEVAERVADRLVGFAPLPLVFDPVMVATSGAVLADEATIAAFERLMAIAALVTPNLPELAALTGRGIDDLAGLEAAALALAGRTGAAVLAKGGHLPGKLLTDVLAHDGRILHRWEAERIETTNTHGTGCTLASGIAALLGRGHALIDAVTGAREYVQAAILRAPGLGGGHGPLSHVLGTVPWELARRV